MDYSDEFVDIVEKLLDKNQAKRLGSKGGTDGGVKEVLAHPWFSDIDVRQVEAMKIPPPLKPDIKDGQIDFKYFNLKQQTEVDSFMPAEKEAKVRDNQHKFKDFDTANNKF